MGLTDQLAVANRDTVWVAGAGSYEYNLVVDGESDFDAFQFIYPSFSDLYYKRSYVKDLCSPKAMVDLKTYDIRSLPDLLYKQSIDILQLLFAQHSEIDPASHGVIQKIIGMRDKIMRMNLFKFYKSNFHQAKKKMKLVEQSVKEDGTYDGKEAMFIYRILRMMVNFADNDFVMSSEMIRANSYYRTFLLGLRDGGQTFPWEQAEEMLTSLFKVVEDLEPTYQAGHDKYSEDGEKLWDHLRFLIETELMQYFNVLPNKI